MDNNSIAILQDYQSSIENSFKKIERLLNDAEGAELSQQNLAVNNINNELKAIKGNIGLIKFEIANLKEESNRTKWNEITAQINSRTDSYKERLDQLRSGHSSNDINDPMNIDAKVDLSKLTSQQVMDRGDKILQADKNAINRMKKIVYQDLDTMKEVNKELLLQHEKLENADNDLKEIDNSLNRAGKQIKTMAKMMATDKLIMCLICCILLVVIAIVIASLVIDTDDEDKNATQDTFQN
jgi:chromosome segregation ATPase